ncbi:hypothetical protein VTL71DRAFT_11966 [Oculimacula yallundae]|uniref:Uncharacterized protein n=1 Tax=Oculimacula yallundae TaxID=86028 RepID=A0ABR4CTE0_9HELO
MTPKAILILGAGPNAGLHITKYFSEKSHKTVAVARNLSADINKIVDLVIKSDFSNPSNIKAILDEVKEKVGIPNVVVYNAYANPMAATGDPFTIPLDDFIAGLNTNMVSPYAAMSEAITGVKRLPREILKTFIYTGNLCMQLVMPVAMNLSLGERVLDLYYELATMKDQGIWGGTFVKEQGYVDFEGRIGSLPNIGDA